MFPSPSSGRLTRKYGAKFQEQGRNSSLRAMRRQTHVGSRMLSDRDGRPLLIARFAPPPALGLPTIALTSGIVTAAPMLLVMRQPQRVGR